MPSSLKGRDFISTQDWSLEELEELFTLAEELKVAKAQGRATPLLSAKTLYMIFFDASTRTRNSFETGMTQLGGHGIYLSPDKMQISHGENAKDTANVLSRYGEGIAIRHCAYGEGNAYLNEVARHASIPLLNMQCDVYHPCQILADYLTIRQKFGNTKGLKLGVAWTSAPNYVRPLSVPQSLILMMPRFGIDVTLAYPPEFKLMPEIEAQARANAEAAGATFEISDRFEDAFQDADAVIPKSWGPLVTTQNVDEGLALIEKYPTWRCDSQHMQLGKEQPDLHAPAAGRSRARGHRRGDRRSPVGGVRRGREPATRSEGAHGADAVESTSWATFGSAAPSVRPTTVKTKYGWYAPYAPRLRRPAALPAACWKWCSMSCRPVGHPLPSVRPAIPDGVPSHPFSGAAAATPGGWHPIGCRSRVAARARHAPPLAQG